MKLIARTRQATKSKQSGRYHFIFRGIDGKKVSHTSINEFPKGISKRIADEKATKIYAKYVADNTIDDSALLRTCIERTLTIQENKGVKGMDRLRRHAAIALEWDNGNSIHDIVKVAHTLRDDMLSRRKPNGEKYSNNYIKKLMNPYIMTAKLAYEEWEITQFPLAQKIKSPKAEPSRERYLTQDEAAKIINCCDYYTGHIVKFFLLTGIRHGEFQRIKDEDISSDGTLTIDGKTKKKRSMVLSNEALESAREIGFPCEYTYDQIANRFRRGLKKAGVTNMGIHDLRHTFASWMIQDKGIELQELQQLLGHSNINQTTKYAHLDQRKLAGLTANLTINQFKKRA